MAQASQVWDVSVSASRMKLTTTMAVAVTDCHLNLASAFWAWGKRTLGNHRDLRLR